MVQEAGTRDVKMPVPPESRGHAFPDDHGIMVFSSRVLGSVSRNLSLTKGLEPGHHDRHRARGVPTARLDVEVREELPERKDTQIPRLLKAGPKKLKSETAMFSFFLSTEQSYFFK